MLTTDEVAAALELPETTVRRYAARSVIPAIRVGKAWRFESVEAVLRGLSYSRGNALQKDFARSARRAV